MKNFVFILGILFSINVFATSSLELAYSNFEPFIWQQNGQAKGIYVDVLKEALEKRMKIPIHFQLLPYRRILYQLKTASTDGVVDISMPELLGLTKVGKVPIAVGIVGAFTYKNHPRIQNLNAVNSLTELSSYRLLSYQNDDWAHNSLHGLNVDYGARDIHSALSKLLRKRGDVFLKLEQVAHHYIHKFGFENQLVQIPDFAMSPSFFQLHLSKQSEYINELPRLDLVLTEMLNDGTIDAIYTKYNLGHDKHYSSGGHKAISIKLVHYWAGAMKSSLNELIQGFNQSYPLYNLKNIALEHEGFKQAIKLMLFGGSSSDIYSNWAGARTQLLVDSGRLEPIDDLWQQAKLSQRFSSTVEQACTYNNKKYAIPMSQHLAVFFYNKRLFTKLGLTPPRTWAEFLNLGDTLIQNGVIPVALGSKEKWPSQFWFDYLLLRTAGPEYRERLMKGEASYTDEQVVKVYEQWKMLIDKGFFNDKPNQYTWTQAADLLRDKKAAMTLMGTWLIRYFDEQLNWQENSDYGFFVFPSIKDGIANVTVGPIDLMVQAKSSHKEATKQALLFLTEKKSQQLFSKGSGSLAPNINIPASFYSPMKQELLNISKSTQHWAFNYDLATAPAVSEIGLSSFFKFLEQPDLYKDILKQSQKAIEQHFKSIIKPPKNNESHQ